MKVWTRTNCCYLIDYADNTKVYRFYCPDKRYKNS